MQDGVNLIDTADSYGPEVSEHLIAEALHPYPDDLVIATKGGLAARARTAGSPRPARAAQALLRGLAAAAQARADRPLPVSPRGSGVPIEDSVGALVELQQEGKIRLIGVSNVDGEQLERAQQIADVVSVQNRYSFADRSSDEVLAACEEQELAFLPWAPIEAADSQARRGAGRGRPRTRRQPGQVAIAWLLPARR